MSPSSIPKANSNKDMNQIELKTKSTFGNFAFALTALVSEEQRDALAVAGLLQLAQRSPASKAEKALGGFEKRPKDFKRTDIAFSEESAKKLKGFFEDVKITIGDGEDAKEQTMAIEAVVSEYVPGEGSEPKFVDEKKVVAAKNGDATALGTLAEKVGFEYEEESELTVENIGFLRAIRAHLKARMAELQKGL